MKILNLVAPKYGDASINEIDRDEGMYARVKVIILIIPIDECCLQGGVLTDNPIHYLHVVLIGNCLENATM